MNNDLTTDQSIHLFIQNQGILHFNVEDIYSAGPELDMAEELLLENTEEADSTLLEEEVGTHQIWTMMRLSALQRSM